MNDMRGVPRKSPSELWLHTFTTSGTVNTACVRFSKTQKQIGSDITYIDSVAEGAKVQFTTPGVYCVSAWVLHSNSNQKPVGLNIIYNPVGAVTSINAGGGSEIIGPCANYAPTASGESSYNSASVTKHFYAGDFIVIAIQGDGLATTAGSCGLIVTKIS